MAIFSDLQELIKMKDLIVLPRDYNHQWEALRMKIDTAIDKIQEMVMDSHLQAARNWCDEVAATMAEMQMRSYVNRQFRSDAFYPPEPEPEPQPTTFEIRAPWVEEILNQSKRTEDTELRTELDIQKKKQQALEDKIEALATEQKLMKEQQAELIQNQVQANSKMA